MGDVLAVARPVDVDADGMHGETVEDGGGKCSVAEVAAPLAERDVRGDGGRDLAVAAVDEVVEGVCRGRLVAALLDRAEADVVDDEEVGSGPPLEATWVGAVSEASMEVVEEVDAAGVAHPDALLAGPEGDGFEDVALARAAGASDDEVVVPMDEVELSELEDEGLVERGLEGPVERLEGLLFGKAAGLEAASDALLELVGCLDSEDVLEECGRAGALAGGPGQVLIELGQGARQSEERDVSAESPEDVDVAVVAVSC
jgi:hypothetical protein